MANPLKTVLDEMAKVGNYAVQRLGDRPLEMPRVSSGSVSLDMAMGGGYPQGRIIELYGPESGGKTLLALTAIAACQKAGGRCLFVDAENSLEPVWAARIGVDTKELLIDASENAEDTMRRLEIAAVSNEFDLIVVDSVAALSPKDLIGDDRPEHTMGLFARVFGNALRALNTNMQHSKTVVIFLNHLRNKITMFGDPETTPGGLAFKHYASIRVRVSKASDSVRYDSAKQPIGHDLQVKCVKNKTAPPLRKAKVPITYSGSGQLGVIHALDFAYAGEEKGLLTFSGGVKYGGKALDGIDVKFKSWDDFYAWIMDPVNSAVVQKMKDEIINHVS